MEQQKVPNIGELCTVVRIYETCIQVQIALQPETKSNIPNMCKTIINEFLIVEAILLSEDTTVIIACIFIADKMR